MKAISADALPAILERYGVGRSRRGHGFVKDGVEACIMPRLREPAHHVANQRDRLGIVQRGKHDCLFEILQCLLGDSFVVFQQRSGVYYPVAHRVDPGHPGPAHGVLKHCDRILVGCAVRLWSRTAQLLALGVAKSEVEGSTAHAADFPCEQRARPGELSRRGGAFSRLENGEFNGRRPTVDNQYVRTTTRALVASISTLHPACRPQMNITGVDKSSTLIMRLSARSRRSRAKAHPRDNEQFSRWTEFQLPLLKQGAPIKLGVKRPAAAVSGSQADSKGHTLHGLIFPAKPRRHERSPRVEFGKKIG